MILKRGTIVRWSHHGFFPPCLLSNRTPEGSQQDGVTAPGYPILAIQIACWQGNETGSIREQNAQMEYSNNNKKQTWFPRSQSRGVDIVPRVAVYAPPELTEMGNTPERSERVKGFEYYPRMREHSNAKPPFQVVSLVRSGGFPFFMIRSCDFAFSVGMNKHL